MALMNYTTMQITAKIVYYGPGLCGKTSNLQWIHQKTAARSRGEMLSLETETDRTLFFDLLPLDVGVIGGMKVRLQLYTVPGQVFYNATRRLVLKGVDGIVFVADSQEAAFDGNRESLGNLATNLAEQDLTLAQVPMVFQYNKRDIRKITSVDALQQALNPAGVPYFEAAALHGLGVFETLKGISRLALARIKQRILEDTERDKPAAKPAAPVVPTPIPEPAAEPEWPEPPAVEPPAPSAASVPSEVDEVFSRLVPAEHRALTAPSHLEVEFAEEDTGKHVVRPVQMKGALDIQAELAKLRALTTTSTRSAPRSRTREADPRLDEFIGLPRSSRLDLKRKAGVEIPAERLATASDVKLHLTFVGPDGEERVENAVTLKLGGHRPLDRLNLRLDLEIKGKA